MTGKYIIACRINERLNALRMTKRELARQTGKTEATINRWTKGNRIPLATEIPKLKMALKCTGDYLLGLSDDPKKTWKQEQLEQLKKCEQKCEECKYRQAIVDKCKDCGTYTDIKRLEGQINSMEGCKAKDLLPLGEAVAKGIEAGLKEGAKCTEI